MNRGDREAVTFFAQALTFAGCSHNQHNLHASN